MSHRETVLEANRQMRLLMSDSSKQDRQRLEKYLRPIPPIVQRRDSNAVNIGEILPSVLDGILQKMHASRRENLYAARVS